MIFNSFNFIILFPLLFLAYYAIPVARQQWRNVYLLVVSYLLYIKFNPAYALILLGVTAVTYLAALTVEKRKNKIRDKFVLATGVLLALLPLLIFKYYNFINESITSLVAMIGLKVGLPGLNWAVPVGISFFRR